MADRRTKKMLLEDLEQLDGYACRQERDKTATLRLLEQEQAAVAMRTKEIESLNHRLTRQMEDTRTLAMRCQHLKGIADGMAMMAALQAGREPKEPDALDIHAELEGGRTYAPKYR